jgi:signal transduction histidine kinase/ActR/RegA family two-component response regulator
MDPSGAILRRLDLLAGNELDVERAGPDADQVVLVVVASVPPDLDQLLSSLIPAGRRSPASTLVVWQTEPDSNAAEAAIGSDLGSDLGTRAGFRELTDNGVLRANTRYFVPPSCRIWFEGNQIRMATRAEHHHHPLDRLLCSLAEGWGARSVTVVQQAPDGDGECGQRAIRIAGGLALAPAEPAAYPALGGPGAVPGGAHEAAAARRGRLPATVREPARLSPRGPHGHSSVERVLSLPPRWVSSARAACDAAIRRAEQRRLVRVWMPECRDGSTVYLIAMLLSDAGSQLTSPPNLMLFGTDDDEEALAAARAGRYRAGDALGMDPDLRSRYTFDEGETIRVCEALREKCIFKRHTLLRNLPMARMDLVVIQGLADRFLPAQRNQLAEDLHFSLARNGLLLALDPGAVFPTSLFERLGDGYWRAWQGRGSALARPPQQMSSGDPAAPQARDSLGRLVAGASAASASGRRLWARAFTHFESFLHTIGMPLLLLDHELRVFHASREALQSFGLGDTDAGLELTALSSRLPGGAELVPAARRVLEGGGTQELSIHVGERVYLARVAAAGSGGLGGVSLAFTDVTALEVARAQAVAQRHQQAAIARISDLAVTFTDVRRLYEESLAAVFGNIAACSAGLIVELPAGPGALELAASRGLGSDALATLRDIPGATSLLDAAVERRALVSSWDRHAAFGGAASPLALPRAPGAGREPGVAPELGGLACPIIDERRVLGVVALYGHTADIDDPGNRHFVQAVAGVLGGALVRERTRRRLALELEVSTLLAGATDLNAVGEGLLRALGAALGVEHVELWSARDAALERWERLLPSGSDPGPEPEWPAQASALLAASESEPCWPSSDPDELMVPLRRPALPLSVLRLRGDGLGAPDSELLQGFQRIARMLVDFLDRQRSHALALESEATLREADQQKDDFIAMLGHELRNPMAAIRNATELLSRIEEPSPQLVRLQQIFDRQTVQTTKLIDGLLDVARVARGKVELELLPHPLVELVRQVVDDRRQQFQRRELDLRLPDAELWVLADRVRLVQILDNLISNALKFTADQGRITISLEQSGETGSIRVEDDGVGIEPELLEQIFEPFRQGPTSVNHSHGLGLGLALVKGLAALHGFRLSAHSAGVGRGARFEINFPLAAAVETPAAPSRPEARHLDLLMVEDNQDIAETMAELLGAAGHHVVIAGSAERALELLQESRPDVVLCDIGLPGMDGVELAARLRAHPVHRTSKLIAMTGFGDASTQVRIEAAGFDYHLIKPVRLDALRQALSRVAQRPARAGGEGPALNSG